MQPGFPPSLCCFRAALSRYGYKVRLGREGREGRGEVGIENKYIPGSLTHTHSHIPFAPASFFFFPLFLSFFLC